MKQIQLYLIISSLFLLGSPKQKADIIVYNGVVYTVDKNFSKAQSFVIKDGKILDVGTDEQILSKFDSEQKLNAEGKPIYPGFIDAHCHFLGYGLNLQRVNLAGTKSFDEVIQKVVEFSKKNNSEWIMGRGWDQNDWEVEEFPDNTKLDSLFPHTPVYLRRIDGHAALVNSEALRRAGIYSGETVDGGLVETKDGKLTGILVDNAVDLVAKVVPAPTREEQIQALLSAQKNCFGVGLTTIDDAGLDREVIELIDSLQKSGSLKMRIYAMASGSEENLNYYLQHGPYKTERLNVSAFKFYADGALGSRGALLLQPYSDKPGHYGFLVTDSGLLKKSAERIVTSKFQMCTHCIGDSANRLMLDIYGSVLKAKNGRRWRIEHAQVVNQNDFEKFGQFSIIPSVQPTHATSDMYWAKDRLGNDRVKGAYAYKDLLKQNGMVADGSDFPVESINPLLGFYAAVSRKDLNGFPSEGFQIENALTREEALRAMTIWAAFSNFEENEKGSIEAGKFADFVVLNKDIMSIDIKEVPSVEILYTYINGEQVFK